VELPAGARDCWPESKHEPLVIGFVFSLLAFPPWTLQHHRRVLDLAGSLQEVWHDVSQVERPLLHQLCGLTTELGTMP